MKGFNGFAVVYIAITRERLQFVASEVARVYLLCVRDEPSIRFYDLFYLNPVAYHIQIHFVEYVF